MSDAIKSRRNHRLTLLLLAGVAVLPLLAAYVLYLFWRPSSLTNYGELLPPTSIADAVAPQPDGSRFDFARFKGKWVMLMVDSGQCDAYCQGKLYRMRQVRLTQGQNMERIERAWLIDDEMAPAGQLRADYEGTYEIRVKDRALLSRLPARSSARAHIYIVDPLGNVILRYAGDADATGMKKDFNRLLRASRIG